MTPGNTLGLMIGAALLPLAVWMPASWRGMLATMCLFFGVALVNVAPENPYFAAKLQMWHQGQFFNFNGLTRLVSSLWPFVALGYLTRR